MHPSFRCIPIPDPPPLYLLCLRLFVYPIRVSFALLGIDTILSLFLISLGEDVFLEEAAYIDSYNPDIGKGGVINFSKHRRLSRIIRTLEQYGNSTYSDLTPIQSVIDFILQTPLLDDDTLQKMSLNCEPPSSFV